MTSLRDQFGLRLLIGGDDWSQLLTDGASWSSVDPGGHEAASFPLPVDAPQILRGAPVKLFSGLKTVWEGRVSQPQRSLGSKTLLQCQGYGARFADLSGSMVFVDRDLTRWGQPSLTRQVALVSGNFQLATSQVAADPSNNTPALVQSITDSWVSPFEPVAEAWYDPGPQNLIAKVYYQTSIRPTNDNNWAETLYLSSDAQFGAQESSGNLGNQTGSSGYFTPATAYRFAALQHWYQSTPAGAQGTTFNFYWHNIAAYGNHGLTGRGSDPVGFYPSDIFGWVLSQIPDLQPGVVQLTDASGYIIPHSAYYLPVTLDSIVNDVSVAQGWHWGVWESLAPLTGDPRPRADFRPRPAAGAFTASCRRSDCETFDIREDLAGQFNACTTSFSQVDGTQGAVTVTADNPILDQAGIPIRTLVLNGGTMTPATATLYAAEALALTNAQARVAGTMNIISAIDGGTRAPWDLKAGIDRIRVIDMPSTDAWGQLSDVPISRVETSISSGGISTSVEVGTGGASLVETIQSRLSAATFLSGQGG